MRKRIVLASILSIMCVSMTLLSVANANESVNIVHEKVLKNGLKVLVKEDRRAPVMVSQVWYKVGASYEHEGITGLSHVLEHMMFQGTDNLAPGEFSKIIAANGGRENAFTGTDYTAYFQTMEASRLEVSMRLESERMRHLKLEQVEFVKEREVVMEERRLRTEDKPQAQAYEYFKAIAYSTSPYRNPIIGWMQDLENMTLSDLAQWYKRWYAPNNATLVVVGDVQADEVFALAEKYFGALPAVTFEPVKKRQEIPQVGVRRAVIKQTAKVPYLLMGYKVPVLNTVAEEGEAEVYALEMLAGILSAGGSSRLVSDVVREQQIASSLSAGFDLYSRLPSLFTFDGVPTDKHDLKALEQAVYKQIDRLKTERVSEQELTRIKAQVIAASVYEKDSNFYQAMQLGRLETVGLNWKKEAEYVEKLKQVTPQQIQAVAQKYFNEDQLTVVYMQPEAAPPESNKKAGDK